MGKTTSSKDAATKLTAREYQILMMTADLMTAAEIADKLYTSRRTVEFHLGNIFDKLNVSGRKAGQEAVREAKRVGLIPANAGL